LKILDFLLENWDSALIVLAVIAVLIVLVVQKQWGILDKALFALVTWAEREYGAGTGTLKLAEVIQRAYPYIPAIIKVFLSERRLEELVNAALTRAKEVWEKNPRLIDTAAK
jgi:hypothetical protein